MGGFIGRLFVTGIIGYILLDENWESAKVVEHVNQFQLLVFTALFIIIALLIIGD